MNLREKLYITNRIGKWYREQTLDFMYEYTYIKGLSENFGTLMAHGYHIEIHKQNGDSHRFAHIHVDTAINIQRVRNGKEITDKKLIETLDSTLGTLFYNIP